MRECRRTTIHAKLRIQPPFPNQPKLPPLVVCRFSTARPSFSSACEAWRRIVLLSGLPSVRDGKPAAFRIVEKGRRRSKHGRQAQFHFRLSTQKFEKHFHAFARGQDARTRESASRIFGWTNGSGTGPGDRVSTGAAPSPRSEKQRACRRAQTVSRSTKQCGAMPRRRRRKKVLLLKNGKRPRAAAWVDLERAAGSGVSHVS